MYSDRQNTAWIVARAAQLVADNELEAVDKSVVKQINAEFIPNPDVPNDLIKATVANLNDRVQEVTNVTD